MIDFLHVVPEAGIFIWDTRKAAINIYSCFGLRRPGAYDVHR